LLGISGSEFHSLSKKVEGLSSGVEVSGSEVEVLSQKVKFRVQGLKSEIWRTIALIRKTKMLGR
jgi:hypothetical protein